MVSGFLSPDLEKAAVPADFREYLESIGYRIDVDPGLGGGVRVDGGMEGHFCQHLHIGRIAEGALRGLGARPEVVGNDLLLIASKGH